jgi:hypothetical protein
LVENSRRFSLFDFLTQLAEYSRRLAFLIS